MWVPDLRILLAAILLDHLMGDPRWMPHITRYSGMCAQLWEGVFRRVGLGGIAGGTVFYLMMLVSVLGLAWLAHTGLSAVHPLAAKALEAFLIYQCVAFRDLMRHIAAVLKPLLARNLQEARHRVGWVVGRDTATLDERGVARAGIEALAESSNDGVIAPIFWAAVAGPAGALLFRVTNTLDSMVGHRDERYERFGKVSARMDDLLGIIPARLSALLIWLARPNRQFLRITQDARLHRSPNAGWPEAATAHGLGIRLGGTNYYEGVAHNGPIFNACGRDPGPSDLKPAMSLINSAYLLLVASLLLGLVGVMTYGLTS